MKCSVRSTNETWIVKFKYYEIITYVMKYRSTILFLILSLFCNTNLFAQSSIKDTKQKNWYGKSFYLFHLDYHTKGDVEVGSEVDVEETLRLLKLSKPDVIQVHAKGNPGWTSYPSKVGYTPPKLAKDVMQSWKDAATRGGYHFSAYYNLGRDGEIMKRHPEWNRVDAMGKLVDNSLCYQSGVAENYLFPMIIEIIDLYHPEGFWLDGSCFTVQNCYCDKCQERFRKETPEYSGAAPRNPEDEGWDEFKEMQRQIYRELVENTSKTIKRHDPDCLVAINLAYGNQMPEEAPSYLDYLTCDIGNKIEQIPAQACWFDGQNKPFDLMTTAFYNDYNNKAAVPKPKGQIEQEMAAIISNGGHYFVWDDPSPKGGLSKERFEMLGEVVAPFLRSRQEWCVDSKRVPDVSLFQGSASHYAITRSSKKAFSAENETITDTDLSLREMHLNHEMISDERLSKLDIHGQLLIIEDPLVLTSENRVAILNFVTKGGTLLITGHGIEDPELQKITGLKVVKTPRVLGVEGSMVNIDDKQISLNHQIASVIITNAKKIIVGSLANGEEIVLLALNKLGKGRVYSVPFPLFSSRVLGTEMEIPGKFKEYVMERILPVSKRLTSTDAPSSVDIILREKDNQKVVHLVNMAKGERTRDERNSWNLSTCIKNIPPTPPFHITLSLTGKPKSVILQPQGLEVKDWSYKKGYLQVKVPSFDIHQMLIVNN